MKYILILLHQAGVFQLSAQHVSGDNLAHLQEHLTVCYSLWYNIPTMLPARSLEAEELRFQATVRQHRGYIIPQAVTHSQVLLKMGEIIARNMLS